MSSFHPCTPFPWQVGVQCHLWAGGPRSPLLSCSAIAVVLVGEARDRETIQCACETTLKKLYLHRIGSEREKERGRKEEKCSSRNCKIRWSFSSAWKLVSRVTVKVIVWGRRGFLLGFLFQGLFIDARARWRGSIWWNESSACYW